MSAAERVNMWTESLRICHGLAQDGWDGLTIRGMHFVWGDCIRHVERMECISIRGRHTNQPIAIELDVGVNAIIELLHRDFGILWFLCFWVSISKDIHLNGRERCCAPLDVLSSLVVTRA